MSFREAEIEAQAAFHAGEMNVGETRWERLVARLEAKLGCTIDGDNSEEAKSFLCADGFSLDETFEMYQAGKTFDDIFDAILLGGCAEGERMFAAGLNGLCEAETRAIAAGKTEYAERLRKAINDWCDSEIDAANAAERAFGC